MTISQWLILSTETPTRSAEWLATQTLNILLIFFVIQVKIKLTHSTFPWQVTVQTARSVHYYQVSSKMKGCYGFFTGQTLGETIPHSGFVGQTHPKSVSRGDASATPLGRWTDSIPTLSIPTWPQSLGDHHAAGRERERSADAALWRARARM